MLANLFEDDEVGGLYSTCLTAAEAAREKGLYSPPPPRLASGLCGIDNQGATCYLNSLLQTLLLTPEFREALFSLSSDQLGHLEDANKQDSMVRVIPIQLQRLFARLLLSNQQSVSTSGLTDSFGWTNSEELQQHDVQELNRILFCAIEDSLVGTTGQTLISNLYHGTIVNQIICQECGRVSEREEDFLDLSLPVAGSDGLENSLYECYVAMETMDGNNQYRCEKCAKLVDAKKGAKIRSLPPVLSLSLLRFSFDFIKMERYKETGKFTFPRELDMAPFCENPENVEYELFSVVIHRGGTHGGHYHAYIRDVDKLGCWIHPEDEEIQLPTDPSAGKIDFIDCEAPVDLMKALLEKCPPEGMAVDKLCTELVKQTGVSWNKRFKKKYGPINKFFKKYDEVFDFDEATCWVCLKSPVVNCGTPAGGFAAEEEVKTQVANERDHSKTHVVPPDGHCWFNFDDCRVHPILCKDIEKQFSGKESAYMLFYRNKTMNRPKDACSNPLYALPESVAELIRMENEELERKREEYDIKVNKLELKVHFSKNYEYTRGALHLINEDTAPGTIVLDRRKTVGELKSLIQKEVSDEWSCIHVIRHLPAGSHLYVCVSLDDSVILKDIGLEDGNELFCWDGNEVNGQNIPTGSDTEPLLVNIALGNSIHGNHSVYGFQRCMTMEDVCNILSDVISYDPSCMLLSRKVFKEEELKLLKFVSEDMCKTLDELNFKDRDTIFVLESSESSDLVITLDTSLVSVVIENRIGKEHGCLFPHLNLEIDKEKFVVDLKSKAVSSLSIDAETTCRLRVDDQDLGLKPPLHEQQTIAEAHIKSGTQLVLEEGMAPTTSQVCLTFTTSNSQHANIEIIIDRNATVLECLDAMLKKANFSGDWHLRKTNWCGDPDAILDVLDISLEQCQVRDGSLLLLEEGKLPPKGHINLPVWLYNLPGTEDERTAWITHHLHNLSLTQDPNSTPKQLTELTRMGSVSLSKESTLLDLKVHIMALPAMADAPLPTLDFMRVRLMDRAYPSTILRSTSQTLQRLKVTNSSKICVQCLAEEENLKPNQILLNVQQRIPESRSYTSPREVLWDVSKGVGPETLRQLLADTFFIPVGSTSIAKHFPDKFEWLEITNQAKTTKNNKKSGKQGSTNIRHAPYHIQDGSVIGVKDLRLESFGEHHDFATHEDDKGLEAIHLAIEEKRKMREGKRSNAEMSFPVDNKQSARPEIGISIKVGNFQGGLKS